VVANVKSATLACSVASLRRRRMRKQENRKRHLRQLEKLQAKLKKTQELKKKRMYRRLTSTDAPAGPLAVTPRALNEERDFARSYIREPSGACEGHTHTHTRTQGS
jgi:hypothetical protein